MPATATVYDRSDFRAVSSSPPLDFLFKCVWVRAEVWRQRRRRHFAGFADYFRLLLRHHEGDNYRHRGLRHFLIFAAERFHRGQ